MGALSPGGDTIPTEDIINNDNNKIGNVNSNKKTASIFVNSITIKNPVDFKKKCDTLQKYKITEHFSRKTKFFLHNISFEKKNGCVLEKANGSPISLKCENLICDSTKVYLIHKIVLTWYNNEYNVDIKERLTIQNKSLEIDYIPQREHTKKETIYDNTSHRYVLDILLLNMSKFEEQLFELPYTNDNVYIDINDNCYQYYVIKRGTWIHELITKYKRRVVKLMNYKSTDDIENDLLDKLFTDKYKFTTRITSSFNCFILDRDFLKALIQYFKDIRKQRHYVTENDLIFNNVHIVGPNIDTDNDLRLKVGYSVDYYVTDFNKPLNN